MWTASVGDIQFSAFLSPANSKGWIWGVGAVAQAPTHTDSAPIITANWDADSDDTWTVPVGGGVGKIFHFGRLPVNTQISAYYNVEKPEYGAHWQLRVQAQLMFPK